MRSAMRVVALAAAVAALPGGAGAQEATDQNDRAVHAFLSAVDVGELQQSMLARERAANADVRAFAQKMIADHSSALHTREMLMQTERSGLLGRMDHAQAGGTDASRNQGPMPPAYGPGNGGNASGGNVPEGQRVTSKAPASDGAAVGELPPAYGPGNGTVNVENSAQGAQAQAGQAQAAQHAEHAGHEGMGGLPPGVTPAMVQELHAALMAHPMSRPVMEAGARNLQVLQGITGPQFDAAYMDAQIGAHRYALTSLDRMMAQGGVGDDIRGAMRMMRTAVAAHLQTAEQIRARL